MSVLTESFVFFQLYQVSTDIFFSDFLLLFLCERENFDFFLSPIVLYGQGAVGNNSRPFVPMMVYLSMAKKKERRKKPNQRAHLIYTTWFFGGTTISFVLILQLVQQLQASMDDASNRLVPAETTRSKWINPTELSPQQVQQQMDQLKVRCELCHQLT